MKENIPCDDARYKTVLRDLLESIEINRAIIDVRRRMVVLLLGVGSDVFVDIDLNDIIERFNRKLNRPTIEEQILKRALEENR